MTSSAPPTRSVADGALVHHKEIGTRDNVHLTDSAGRTLAIHPSSKYFAYPDRKAVRFRALTAEPAPRADSLWRSLAHGCALGLLVRTGAGTRAEAFRYAVAAVMGRGGGRREAKHREDEGLVDSGKAEGKGVDGGLACDRG